MTFIIELLHYFNINLVALFDLLVGINLLHIDNVYELE